ncbi:hypothetical protein B0H67DRAFT_336655 [Lasiosphaeris hirsuta]|uniref:Uncharacterized protein n=1 Tax=Lasiosphaeris hirsuta TaxID=260670 RepID=A0AA40A2X0_9PEZI|nr:hypothetical protein B0H67DRAFT_336655 [Lasiosphaeris hirsuta]
MWAANRIKKDWQEPGDNDVPGGCPIQRTLLEYVARIPRGGKTRGGQCRNHQEIDRQKRLAPRNALIGLRRKPCLLPALGLLKMASRSAKGEQSLGGPPTKHCGLVVFASGGDGGRLSYPLEERGCEPLQLNNKLIRRSHWPMSIRNERLARAELGMQRDNSESLERQSKGGWSSSPRSVIYIFYFLSPPLSCLLILALVSGDRFQMKLLATLRPGDMIVRMRPQQEQ